MWAVVAHNPVANETKALNKQTQQSEKWMPIYTPHSNAAARISLEHHIGIYIHGLNVFVDVWYIFIYICMAKFCLIRRIESLFEQHVIFRNWIALNSLFETDIIDLKSTW